MKKVWSNYGAFRDLEPKVGEFLRDQERVLDGDHGWTPRKDADPPIGGEVAWPLIGEENDDNEHGEEPSG
jgi:hypothetical protein